MKKLIFCVFVCSCLLNACSSTGKSPENAEPKVTYKKISAAGIRQMISEITDYSVLDVRSEKEYRKRHITGAVWIPLKEVEARVEKELPDKNQVIFVHCRYGGRSTIAAKKMVNMGYKNVYDIRRINKWPREQIQEFK